MKNKDKYFIFGLAVLFFLLVFGLITLVPDKTNTNYANLAVNETNNNDATINNTTIHILYPVDNGAYNNSVLTVNYAISGKIDDIARLDFVLFRGSDIVSRFPASFNKETRTGSQIIPQLSEGQYRLLARLVNNKGDFINDVETITNFIINSPL